jgi:transposase
MGLSGRAMLQSRQSQQHASPLSHRRFLLQLHLQQVDAIDAAVSEIDMSRFPTEGHLISWAGLCPKNDESAGKRRSIRMRKGAPWLETTLIQCAWAGVRKKGSYRQAQIHRLRSRRGIKKAIGAVAASILTAAYHMLAHGILYQDLGPDHLDRRALHNLGYAVQITPLAA